MNPSQTDRLQAAQQIIEMISTLLDTVSTSDLLMLLQYENMRLNAGRNNMKLAFGDNVNAIGSHRHELIQATQLDLTVNLIDRIMSVKATLDACRAVERDYPDGQVRRAASAAPAQEGEG